MITLGLVLYKIGVFAKITFTANEGTVASINCAPCGKGVARSKGKFG